MRRRALAVSKLEMKPMDMKNFIAGVVIAGSCMGGCDDIDDGTDIAARAGTSTSCPTWRCGFNSAEVNGRAIRELNLDGLANTSAVTCPHGQARRSRPARSRAGDPLVRRAGSCDRAVA
jgi:hypothetical protein